MASTVLENPVMLGLHLQAGASDGYLVEANQLYDATNDQDVQTTLDNINSNIDEIETNIENVSSELKSATVSSEDGTVIVTAEDSGTDLAVNIDNDTITKAEDGTLSVANYEGENAISISDIEDGVKTVSLLIDSESESYLTNSSSGLKLSGILNALETDANDIDEILETLTWVVVD